MGFTSQIHVAVMLFCGGCFILRWALGLGGVEGLKWGIRICLFSFFYTENKMRFWL